MNSSYKIKLKDLLDIPTSTEAYIIRAVFEGDSSREYHKKVRARLLPLVLYDIILTSAILSAGGIAVGIAVGKGLEDLSK